MKGPSSESDVAILPAQDASPARKPLTFWLTFLAICVSLFLSALEFTAVSTALPTIIQDLHGDDFVWVGSAYPLAATALLPASGGMAEIFGRRTAMLSSLALFAFGSALCGAAKNMSWLIAARTIQGAGGGAIQSVASIVVSDLVPLKERGIYNALIGGTWAIAAAMAPLVGGSLAERGQWRWLFYLNLPIGGVAALLVVFFMKLKTPEGTARQKLAKIDWIGNFLVIASTTAITIGLTWGGVQFPWGSAQVVVPLVIGFCGLGLFMLYEARFAANPIVPFELVSNRTSLSGYLQTFITPIVVIAVIYYLAAYFQVCKGASPIGAGVDALGMTLVIGPSVIFCGASVTITKQYRPQLWLGWVILTVAMGALATLEWDSNLGKSIGLSSLTQVGAGLLQAATYFPVLAPLPVSKNAHALAFFAFCRTFAGVWGITIGGAILQNELQRRLPAEFLAQLPQGVALAYSAIPVVKHLPEPLRSTVRDAFGKSFRVIWEVMVAVAGLGLLSSLLMRALPLHTQVDEKWGIEQGEGTAETSTARSTPDMVTDKETSFIPKL